MKFQANIIHLFQLGLFISNKNQTAENDGYYLAYW